MGLSRSDVFGIVRELVLGRIAEIEITGDNRHIKVRERESCHIVLILHVGVEVRESGDFGLHHQRFNLPVQGEVSTSTGAVEVGLAKPFDLDLSDELADPLASTRLLCLSQILVAGWDSMTSAR